MKLIKYSVLTSTVLLVLSGCSGTGMTNIEREAIRSANNKPIKHYVSTSAIEEYVNRVGKKIIIVSDYPNLDYNFKVIDSIRAEVNFNGNGNGTISVSRGLLKKLSNEAELAAVLGQGIIYLKDNQYYKYQPYTENDALKSDQKTMTYISRAGYDPIAVVDVQNKYLLNQYNNKYSWVPHMYQNLPPSDRRVKANQKVAAGLPKGLDKGEERYNKNVGK